MAQYIAGPDVIWDTPTFGPIHARIQSTFDPDEDPSTIRYHLLLEAAECPAEYQKQGRMRIEIGSENLREDTGTSSKSAAKKATTKKATAAKKTAAKATSRKGGGGSAESDSAPLVPAFSSPEN